MRHTDGVRRMEPRQQGAKKKENKEKKGRTDRWKEKTQVAEIQTDSGKEKEKNRQKYRKMKRRQGNGVRDGEKQRWRVTWKETIRRKKDRRDRNVGGQKWREIVRQAEKREIETQNRTEDREWRDDTNPLEMLPKRARREN